MSVTAMAWAWTINGLGPDPKFVLMALADQADDTGYCWPSQRLIAQRVEMGERTVRRHLKTLQEVGLLTAKLRSSTGGRRSNGYQLHIGAQPDLATHTDPEPTPQPTSDETPEASQPVDNPGEGLPVKMTGRGEPVENSSVDNSGESGLSGLNTATGQNGRLRKRPDWPVALEANSGRSLEANGGRLQYKNHHKNHQTSAGVREQRESELDEPGQVGSGPGRIDQANHGPVLDEPGTPDLAAGQASQPQPEALAEPGQVPETSSGAVQRPEGGRLTAADAELLAACLPAWMQPMDAPGAAQVLALLRERLEAGWTPSGIAQALDAPPPVGGARRLSALVAYRIRDNVNIHLAPKPASRPSVAEQNRREAERAKRAEAIARPAKRPTDEAFAAAFAQVRREHPGLNLLDQSELARQLASSANAGPPGPLAA